MPVVVGLDSPNLATPISPESISTESSRRGSFNPSQLPARDPEPFGASSPPIRLTRKRAAILNTERSNLSPGIGGLALSTASTNVSTSSDFTREQVCLCQPDPKIPRPRNAFILYRQHYQAQVIAQNPGLANPEISKIIGEQWRDQAPEVKDDWKRLAEEEKQRHRRQYPGYRYQPRRAGKSPGIRPLSASPFTDDPGRCPKCNGRYISTPSTPMTPIIRSFEARSTSRDQLPSPLSLTATSRNLPPQQSSSLSQMHRAVMDSPRVTSFVQSNPRRLSHIHPQPLQIHFEKDGDMDLVLSPAPDPKRRRYNPESQLKRGYPSPSPVSFSPSQPYPQGALPMPGTNYRAQQPPSYNRPRTVGPGIQPSPMAQQPRHPYPSRSGTFDESLRLPPLISQVPSPGRNFNNRTDARAENRDSQARSVEAMVMTIPYINKIKVLTKISPPLILPAIRSPAPSTRGAVVAVEGADRVLMSEVGALLNEHLCRDSSCAVKTWTVSDPSQTGSHHEDALIAGMDSAIDPLILRTESSTPGNAFISYLSIISEWHKRSPEITRYITTAAPCPNPNGSPSSSSSGPLDIIPIALLPHGFSLSTSDAHALRIPINDAYAPVDHWQWMATLWRGIVGPDLTVYVKHADREEMAHHGTVEIRGDCAAIVVRVLDGARLDERTARRLGFEVLEIVRSVEVGLGHGKG